MKRRLATEYWVPVFVWLTIIFVFSTDTFAADKTSGVVAALLRFFLPNISAVSIDFWHAAVRKSAHIGAYFVLALLTHGSLIREFPDPAGTKMRTLFLTVSAAILDEIHQGMTLFRTASPIDVGYDCLGAVWALWLINSYEPRRLRTYPVL